MSEPAPRRLALITGASAGIGAAFTRAYAARGFDLALVARRADRLEALGAELSARHGVEAFAVPTDLSEYEAHRRVLEAVAARGRSVDVLVNDAGFGIAHSFAAVPWERQRDFLMTMIVNACGLAHGVIPGMVERGWGRIVNVASVAGFAPGVAGNSLYPGAKSLMISFSQALDAEYGAQGIKATAVCPGATRSEFGEKAGIQDVIDSSPAFLRQTPEAVVAAAIAANEAGRPVVIPGAHNRAAVFLMRHLPGPLVRSILRAGSAKYHLKD